MKNKKIPNMTRAEHKRVLEQAAARQAAAMREAGGHLFQPELKEKEGDIYTRIVNTGNELLQKYYESVKRDMQPALKKRQIISYYSRKDVQNAMFSYAQGRKISVLKNFHPMFGGSMLRDPGDILPIMTYYAQEPGLWPSIHATISRLDDRGVSICDFVVEVDYKKSMVRAFNLSRPIVRLFQELGIDFRIKFSGNSSPHIIIPAEAFPQNWRRVGPCRGLYGKMLDFLRSKIKDPKTLDGSFRNPEHFLRIPYSLNENTGLVSVPMKMESFDRFSWEMARPERVDIIEDWWNIPEDAPERTEALIDLVLGKRKFHPVNFLDKKEFLDLKSPELLSEPVKLGMIKAGEEITLRSNELLQKNFIMEVLDELYANMAKDGGNLNQIVSDISGKYHINRQDLNLLWNWKNKANILAYYERPDVQNFILSYTYKRWVSLENTEDYFTLNNPSEIYNFAAYMIGNGTFPRFWNTNASYNGDGNMDACDIAIQVEKEASNSTALIFHSFDIPSIALYNGYNPLWIIIPFEVVKLVAKGKPPLEKISDIAIALGKYLRKILKVFDGIKIFTYESSIPIPYSIADDIGNVYMPVELDQVYKLGPEKAYFQNIGDIKERNSFITPDGNENIESFFHKIIF